MKYLVIFSLSVLFLSACSTSKKFTRNDFGSPNLKQELLDYFTFKIDVHSEDENYGYTPNDPVMVGGGSIEGPKNQRRFLNALAGPNGEKVEYHRIGSCCQFGTTNSEFGGGMLDMYNVTIEGTEKSVTLFINMYDSDTLRVPVGFSLRY